MNAWCGFDKNMLILSKGNITSQDKKHACIHFNYLMLLNAFFLPFAVKPL